MADSIVPQLNKVFAALIDVLQRHEDTIYRLKVGHVALTAMAREALLRIGVSEEQSAAQIQEQLDSAARSAPPEARIDLDQEIQEILLAANYLEEQMKQRPN